MADITDLIARLKYTAEECARFGVDTAARDYREAADALTAQAATIAEQARELEALRAEVQNLRAALKWYADGEHFTMAVQDAWDTVSGEPQNWWCDEAGTAMVEDGRHAGMVLEGTLTGAQLHAPDEDAALQASEPTTPCGSSVSDKDGCGSQTPESEKQASGKAVTP